MGLMELPRALEFQALCENEPEARNINNQLQLFLLISFHITTLPFNNDTFPYQVRDVGIATAHHAPSIPFLLLYTDKYMISGKDNKTLACMTNNKYYAWKNFI